MTSVPRVLDKLRAIPSVERAEELGESLFTRMCGEESEVSTSSGMPLENRALKETMSRREHVCVLFGKPFDTPDHHEVLMMNEKDQIVGFDVPAGMRSKYEGREDLVWMSEDFAMDPNSIGGEIRVVLVAQELSCIGKEDGAERPVAMYPSPSTDMLLRSALSFDRSGKYATAVVSFDTLR